MKEPSLIQVIHKLPTCLLFLAFLIPGLLLSGCSRQVLQEGQVRSTSAPKFKKEQLPRLSQIEIWFVKPQGEELRLEKVLRSYNGPYTTCDYLDFAMKELTKGPDGNEAQQGLSSELPRGTVLIDIRKKGEKEVSINLSRSFFQGGGIESFETRMEQLRRTVTGIVGPPNKTRVYLDIEGERLTRTVGEGLEVKQPLN